MTNENEGRLEDIKTWRGKEGDSDVNWLIGQIEDLTKERDELKPYEMASLFKDAKIKELETENAELAGNVQRVLSDLNKEANKKCKLIDEITSLTKEIVLLEIGVSGARLEWIAEQMKDERLISDFENKRIKERTKNEENQ